MNIFQDALSTLKSEGLLRQINTVEGPCEKVIHVHGKRMLNLCSNNYLGLATHPKLKQAAQVAIEKYGLGSGGARLLGGASMLHEELENKIQAYRPLGKALLFNTGYMANMGIVTALGQILNTVYCDKSNHASLQEGLRLLDIPFERYRHGDLNHLEKLLLKQKDPEKSLVCSETLFSMDGDFADLNSLIALQKRFGFYLYVDEAHSTGGYGNLLDNLIKNIPEKLILMGTFGKAFGSFGAYVSAAPEIIDFLINKSRPFIFSTSLPPAVLGANIAALDLVNQEPERFESLKKVSAYALQKAVQLGLNKGLSQSHIFPIILGSNEKAILAAEKMQQSGYYTVPVRHPTVARGTARLRINWTSDWLLEEVDQLLNKLVDIQKEINPSV